MGACIRGWYPAAKVTSLDYVESHLEASLEQRVAGNAFQLPFRPGSFDYVFCSLFLHHFQDTDVVRLLRGFGEVARKAVLVIDLERNPIPYYFIAWSRPLLGWDPVTVHDGAISVEAAFRRKELEDLARQAGLQNPRARVFRPAFRIALAAECQKKGDRS
jgi:SAM-dependent methyltransferase